MRDYVTKVDNTAPSASGILSAEEDNVRFEELKQAVSTAGITLDGVSGPNTFTNMLAQAMARYASGGVYYTDSGAANTYVLSTPLSFIMPKALFRGMRAYWKASAANSGASVANVNGLGNKSSLRYNAGALSAGDIALNGAIEMEYSLANDAWLLMPWVYASGGGGGGSNTYNGMSGQIQVFDTPGIYTFTVPAGVTSVIGHCWGAGGAGGDAYAPGTTGNTGGGGGAAGGYSRKRIAVTPAQTISITVGAGGTRVVAATGNTGGTSSIGAHCSATGGPGGINGSNSTLGSPSSSYGGVGSGGDLNLYGSAGTVAVPVTPAVAYSAGGLGGQAPMLTLTGGLTYGAATVGKAGAGGTGGGASNTTAYAGGVGGPGLIIMEW